MLQFLLLDAVILPLVLHACTARAWLAVAGVEWTPARFLAHVAGFQAVYIFDRSVGASTATPKLSVQQLCRDNPRVAQVAAGSLSAVVVGCALGDSWILRCAVELVGIVGFYDVPIPGTGGCTFKNMFPLSKTLCIAAVWTLWMFRLPGDDVHPDPVVVALFATQQALFSICNDIKDIEVDRKNGIVTVPTLLGATGTRAFVCVCFTCMATVAALRDSMAFALGILCMTLFVGEVPKVKYLTTFHYLMYATPALTRAAASS